jgi:hypothetical protein
LKPRWGDAQIDSVVRRLGEDPDFIANVGQQTLGPRTIHLPINVSKDQSFFVPTGSLATALVSFAGDPATQVVLLSCRPEINGSRKGARIHVVFTELARASTLEVSLFQPGLANLCVPERI